MSEETQNLTPKKDSPGDGDWAPAFIAHLSKSANVRASCAKAGISRQAAYARRDSDPDFAKEWASAMDDALDILESVAFQRAAETSDTLLIFLLKSHRRSVYGEKQQVEHSGGTTNTQTHIYIPDNGRDPAAT